VSRDALERREREVAAHRSVIDDVMSASEFDWLRAECARLAALPDVASIDRRG
jgi:hypothetical protein